MSKAFQDGNGPTLQRPVTGRKKSHHPLHQSDAKLQPLVTLLYAFSCAWSRLRVLSFALIILCANSSRGFTKIN